MKPQQASCRITIVLLALLFTMMAFIRAAQADSDVCTGIRVNVTTVGFSPYIKLKVNGKEGWFMVDTGSSYSVIDSHVIGVAASKLQKLKIEGFPYVETETFTPADLSGYPSPRGEGLLGLIAENILSLVSVEFEYGKDSTHMVVSSSACSPRLEGNPNFVEIKQTGYYARDQLHLKQGESNIPRVYATIGNVRVLMGLDSGNEDGYTIRRIGALLVNSAFVNAIRSAGIQMDSEEPDNFAACALSHTSPQSQDLARWKIRNQLLKITSGDGDVALQFEQPIIESTPKECDDLFYSSNSSGVIGASYFQRFGTVVIDAPGERVWVRKTAISTMPKLPRSDAEWRPDNGTGTYTDPHGGHYEGGFLNGQFEGHGHLDNADGNYYDGNFHNGVPEGSGVLNGADKSHYVGNFHNGRFEGHGVLDSATGHYDGDFHNGKYEGHGVLNGTNGSNYVGNFHEDAPEGLGVFDGADKSHYVGNFHNGQFEGHGVLDYASKNHYEGNFHEGVPEGLGVFDGADKSHYVGNFHNGQFEGHGVLDSTIGHYDGDFHNGAPEGQGTVKWPDTAHYTGSFHAGLPEGHGTITGPNGDTFEGQWKNGKIDGYVTHAYISDGHKSRELYHDGVQVAQ